MTNELAVPIWLAVATVTGLVVLACVAVGLVVSVRRSGRRTAELIATAAGDAEALREQLASIEEELRTQAEAAVVPERVPVAVVDGREYVITELGEDGGPRVPARVVPGPLFADILLRESVIKTASLAAGLRRALSPEVRHRIRFEMRREVKRARKQRRADLRQARREWEARQRAGIEGSP
ncbi:MULTISPECIES: hypothetical protein [Nocardioides]|uniref:Uncharacterized protein n=1 Tax=Nocardioides vastitatis TaxID=2568655 RepID=A0ABW0ZGH6_9ACTN|nr:hypothetical protein [Nocardioides sp.]THJ07817.1 hypothetical protein E7Z54_05265 [Nocardioides sp.]